MRVLSLLLLTLALAATDGYSAEVRLLHKDAVVWSQTQVIRGKISPVFSRSGILFLNGTPSPISIPSPGDSFSVPLKLPGGASTIVVAFDSNGTRVQSDTLRYTLGFDVRPEVYPYATVAGSNITLHAAVLDDPDSALLSFHWTPRPSNPAPVTLQNSADSLASFSLGAGLLPGEYYFDLTVTSSHGDTLRPATMVTVDSAGARAFDITRDHAKWIDSAILYSIAPHLFMPDGKLRDITNEIPELADLGVNTIWILPIFPTPELNLGYHVQDYFHVRSDLGTEQDLHDLVSAAHGHGMRVILDLVPNHTTIYHPYAQDAIAYGDLSHYYDFYSHTGTMTQTIGLMQFGGYWYPELVNLNYGNPEVCRMMVEAGRYWIEKFDVDGYRLDMVWAVDQRFPDYMRTWSLAMKRWKPDIFLLGETFASTEPTQDVHLVDERYDAAYDWFVLGRGNWDPPFGDANTSPASDLRSRIAAAGVPGGKVLRFLENNDSPRFIAEHSLAKLKMAATLLFTIHGVPMLYMGQEVGCTAHPWDGTPVFERGIPIRSQDHSGLFQFYQSLIRLRKQYPFFCSDHSETPWITPSRAVYAFHRWEDGHHAFCVLNMVSRDTLAKMIFPVAALGLDTTRTYYLNEALSGESLPVTAKDLSFYYLSLPALAARVFILDTVAIRTTVPEEDAAKEVPASFALEQNYPNPFNPWTTIKSTVGGAGGRGSGVSVKLAVYDVLGREVKVLVDERRPAGKYEDLFDASGLASGVYVYRLTAGSFVQSRKMILLK